MTRDIELPRHINERDEPVWARPPETELQALMEAAPGFDPAPTPDELNAPFDEIVWHMRNLSDEERFILEGYFWENLSFRQLGKRMGYGKSTAERHVKRALVKLRKMVVGVEGADDPSATVQA